MTRDKFFKALVYVLAISLIIIILLLQPYNLFCKISGRCHPIPLSSLLFWSKSGKKTLEIHFISQASKELENKIEFTVLQPSNFNLLDGKNITVYYQITNLTNQRLVLGFDYTALPAEADQYIDKMECLCMKKQILKPKEQVKIPVNLRIDPKLEEDKSLESLKSLTISYTAQELGVKNHEHH